MCHSCSLKIVIDEELKNKNIVNVLLKHYKVKQIQIITYHSQTNRMIEIDHRSIVNMLSKITKREIILDMKK